MRNAKHLKIYFYHNHTPGYIIQASLSINDSLVFYVSVFISYSSIKTIYLYNGSECRGFAFVTYVSPDDATAAVKALDQYDFNGRKIKVQKSKRKEGHSKTPGEYKGPQKARGYGRKPYGGPRRDYSPRE